LHRLIIDYGWAEILVPHRKTPQQVESVKM
jgi:hypothetical protein